MFKKTAIHTVLILSLSVLSGCSTVSVEQSKFTQGLDVTQAASLQAPSTDCEIRKWYNYQVVAIPKINQRWIAKNMTLRERAKRAYEIRHQARMNARFMMSDQAKVKELQARDQIKYGNPNGPSFLYLVQKAQKKGVEDMSIYKKIIQSSSRTSPIYNGSCDKE